MSLFTARRVIAVDENIAWLGEISIGQIPGVCIDGTSKWTWIGFGQGRKGNTLWKGCPQIFFGAKNSWRTADHFVVLLTKDGDVRSSDRSFVIHAVRVEKTVLTIHFDAIGVTNKIKQFRNATRAHRCGSARENLEGEGEEEDDDDERTYRYIREAVATIRPILNTSLVRRWFRPTDNPNCIEHRRILVLCRWKTFSSWSYRYEIHSQWLVMLHFSNGIVLNEEWTMSTRRDVSLHLPTIDMSEDEEECDQSAKHHRRKCVESNSNWNEQREREVPSVSNRSSFIFVFQ